MFVDGGGLKHVQTALGPIHLSIAIPAAPKPSQVSIARTHAHTRTRTRKHKDTTHTYARKVARRQTSRHARQPHHTQGTMGQNAQIGKAHIF